MKLHELSPAPGSVKDSFRKGRGPGSGNGKTAGRGNKGQKARSGGGVRIGFEGGQTPIYRRLPRRGFNNANFTVVYEVVNVSDLNRFPAGSTVTIKELIAIGILPKKTPRFKVLAKGEINVAVTVVADKWSPAAEEKIKAAGGSLSNGKQE